MASSSLLPQSKDDYHAFSGIEPEGIRRRVSESTTGYDVFINHRGPDSKLALALPLYDSLKDSGIRAFLDLEEMELGQSFPSTIETAISSAAVHIAIFSKRYAESPWCLAELILMQQTQAKIIPVFNGVEPWELRHIEKGVYAGAFTKFQSKSRFSEKLDEWKKALQSISYTAGHEIKDLNVRDFLRIVKAVEEEVRKARFLHVAEHPVALDKIVRDFERRCLHTLVQDFETHCRMNEGEMKAKTVGVYGMGGIGKTTLCKELFNRLRRQYDRACFLFDVREASANGKLTSLQEKLVKDLFSEENTSIYSAENGSSYIRNRIKSSRSQSFLIVLDDIDHLQQLDALPIMHMPGNSLVIITTRDEGILLGDRVEVRYHLKEMVKEDARQLFSLHAFSRPYPDSGYEQLVDDFVGVCGGLPLSLQVVGRQVRGRNERYWRSVLEKLGGGYLHPDIKNILQISFDALEYEEQQIFIDIACFFVDYLTSTAIRVWEASGWYAQYGLQTLKDRCLVEELVEESVEDECLFEETDDPVSILRMHDHLRDLGREMANTRNHPPRLWRRQDLKKLESEGFAKILAHTKKRCFYSFFDVSLGSRITFLLGESDESAATSTSLLLLQLDVDEDENTLDSIPSWIALQHIKHLRICNGDFNSLWQQDEQSLPSAFNLIGEAANGAMSNLVPSLLPEAIAFADQATLFRTLNNHEGSVGGALIVCSLVDVSGSTLLTATEMIHGMNKYERPGQWMSTTVIKDQHYKAVRHYYSPEISGRQVFAWVDKGVFFEMRECLEFLGFDEELIFRHSYLERGTLKRWCAWTVGTDEDWRTLLALTAIVDKLHHE